MRFYKLLAFIVLSQLIYAQNSPVAQFSFDDCTATEETGNYNSGIIQANLDCECGVGVNSSSLYFDGSGDSIILDSNLKEIFTGDFSVAFYLRMDNVSDVTSIMSIQGDCNTARDSAFFIRYFPLSNEIVVEYSRNFGEIVTLRSRLPENTCWNHVLFTRSDRTYSLYINGEFVDQLNYLPEVTLGENFDFLVGVTACSGINDLYMRGWIDELEFYNYALEGEEEILALQEFPDQILTQDTTIFEGTSVNLRTGISCAANVSWAPGAGLSNPLIANPVATPSNTTEYTVTFDHGNCRSTDQLTISVLAEEDIKCGGVLLPKAFTPNNDGLNERFGIANSFIVQDVQRFEIFDRWGLKLFETFDKNDSWDGSYKGEAMPPGVYVFKLEYTCMDQRYQRTNTFNILK